MPTRKQRKRAQKERRHEYETVWVDEEGNELEEPPGDVPAPSRERRSERPSDRKKPQQKRPSQRGVREPLPPSWRRAVRRSLILGAVILVFFTLLNGIVSALILAVLYTVLFVPFTYYVDRFAYGRWQRRMGGQPTKKR